jgi:Rha family phage regulatory protein
MNELILTSQNGQAVVSSRQVAENFGKEHKHVLESIENIKAENSALTKMFYETTYQSGTGKNYKEYLMNRDGFTLLTMGFTGKEAMEWKIKYIRAFNEMEKQLTAPPAMSQLEILAQAAQALLEQEKQIKQLSSDVQGIRDIVTLNPNDWRKDSSVLINKMAISMGGYEHVQDLRTESYKLLDERFGVNLKIRLTNKRKNIALGGGSKSKQDKLNYLDVIAEDKKLIEGYVAIVKDMAIKYGA